MLRPLHLHQLFRCGFVDLLDSSPVHLHKAVDGRIVRRHRGIQNVRDLLRIDAQLLDGQRHAQRGQPCLKAADAFQRHTLGVCIVRIHLKHICSKLRHTGHLCLVARLMI